MSLLENKKGLIIGVANDHSISWGIASLCHKFGAQLAFTYQGEVLAKRVKPLAESVGSKFVYECDVSQDSSIENLFKNIENDFGKLDFILHGVAFANKDALKGNYYNISRDDFQVAMNVSVYSLAAIIQKGRHLINDNASIVTLTYLGSERVVPNYNVMGVAKAALETSVKYLANDLGSSGIRVNSISAGPIKTLAATGISDFKSILNYNAKASPLGKNVDLHDIAGTAVYLFSDLSSGVTAENIHVDMGCHAIAVSHKLLTE